MGVGQLLQTAEQVDRVEGAADRQPAQVGLVVPLDRGSQDVEAAALGVLVPDPLAGARSDPAIGHRLAGAEAALVEEREPKVAGSGLFWRLASTDRARVPRAGSCLWVRVETVRRQRAPSSFRSLRVWRVLRMMPSARSAWASWTAVQVRSDSSSLFRALQTCWRRAVSLGGPGWRQRSAATPSAENRLIVWRTVAGWQSRWRPICGGLQPAADSRTISTRSRSAGRRGRSWRSAWTAARCSEVSVRRIIHRRAAHPGPRA